MRAHLQFIIPSRPMPSWAACSSDGKPKQPSSQPRKEQSYQPCAPFKPVNRRIAPPSPFARTLGGVAARTICLYADVGCSARDNVQRQARVALPCPSMGLRSHRLCRVFSPARPTILRCHTGEGHSISSNHLSRPCFRRPTCDPPGGRGAFNPAWDLKLGPVLHRPSFSPACILSLRGLVR